MVVPRITKDCDWISNIGFGESVTHGAGLMAELPSARDTGTVF